MNVWPTICGGVNTVERSQVENGAVKGDAASTIKSQATERESTSLRMLQTTYRSVTA